MQPELRSHALRFIETLSDKQFAEFFYQAVRDRNTSDLEAWAGHLVLANAEKVDDEPWSLDLLALPENRESWSDDADICQSGACATCSAEVRSWAKQALCPVCGARVYCT